MAMDWGLIIFPMPAPMTFAAASQPGSMPICCAVMACMPPKSTQVLVPLPVMKAPRTPMSGENSGNREPV